MLTPAVHPLPSVSLVLILPRQTLQRKDFAALLSVWEMAFHFCSLSLCGLSEACFIQAKIPTLSFPLQFKVWKGVGALLYPVLSQ